MNIYTIGTTQKTAKQFITLLKINNVQKLLDIRLKNVSVLAGYAKGNDLDFILTEGFNIAYEHVPLLAPTMTLLDNYRDKKNPATYMNWDLYEVEFDKLLQTRETLNIFKNAAGHFENVALLCAESKADHCHRRLVAEYIKKADNAVNIIHL